MLKDADKKICVSLTGITGKDWKSKIGEIKELGIERAALILESFSKRERKNIYEALEYSPLKHAPLVHLRNDMSREEIKYLRDRYGCRYFTIHEDSFARLEKWRGFYKDLYLEMNFDNRIARSVDMERIGGFCVDLAHFKVAEERWAREFMFTVEKKKRKIFACNHLSGYDPEKNIDLHKAESFRDFLYIKSLPDFLFGEVIALEVYNPIKEQLKLKKGIVSFLEK